jgi:hypothetical protein
VAGRYLGGGGLRSGRRETGEGRREKGKQTAITQIPNIGPRGQRQRLTLGLLALGVAAAGAIVLFGFGAPRLWRLLLFVPLWSAALGYFQAREKT